MPRRGRRLGATPAAASGHDLRQLTRLTVLAGLPWVVGMVVLVLGVLHVPGVFEVRDGDVVSRADTPTLGLVVGIVLIGAAGLLAVGLAVGRRR